jgi:F420-non-reducing hydrogenase small subunit
LPEKGSVLAPDVALCQTCPRKDSKPEKLSLAQLRRPHEVEIDPATCLLAQGLVCLGPATRSGCNAACISGNMPCTGCLGPTSRVVEQGAKALAGLASLLEGKEEKELEAALQGLPDPAGTFYRYSVAASLLGGTRGEVKHEPQRGH